MAEKNIQRNMREQLSEENDVAVQKALRFLLKNAVAKEDIKGILDVFIEKFKGFKAEFSRILDKQKTEILSTFNTFKNEITKKHSDLDAKVSKIDTTTRAGLVAVSQQIQEEVKKIREEFEDEDSEEEMDEGMEKCLASIEQLTVLLSADNLRNSLESLKDNDRLDASAIRVEVRKNVYESLEEVLKRLLKEFRDFSGRVTVNNVSSYHGPRHETFEVNSSTTDVTLTHGIAAQGTALIVRYNGQTLDYGSHYTVSGNKITFVGITFDDEGTRVLSVTYWS